MKHGEKETKKRFLLGTVLLIAGAHCIHDIFTAFPAPLLPLIIERLDISLTQAGGLVVCLQIPSFLNPILGSLADRGGFHRSLVILAPGTTGTLICCLGLAPSYGALAVLFLTAGISLAALHVGAPVMVNRLSGNRVGLGMGFFMFGGETARTVGPLIAVWVVSIFGLDGMWRVAPVAITSTLVLWLVLSRIPAPSKTEGSRNLMKVWIGMGRLLAPICGILLARSFLSGALTTYLPTYIHSETGSLKLGTYSLVLVEAGGVIGVLITGALSDRFGRRSILVLLTALAPPLLLLFMLTGGWIRFVTLVPLGLVTISTTPVLLALMVENAGEDPAAATGTFMMIAFAARSLILLAVGAMGDGIGLPAMYFSCAVLAVLGMPFAMLLPSIPGKNG